MSISYIVDETIFSCGGVLINKEDDKVYLIYKNTTGEWLLPKGHSDQGETLEATAQREIYEETGYEGEVGELLSVQVRPDTKEPTMNKVIFWFLAVLKNLDQAKNTQMADESYSGEWKTKDEALNILKWDEDKTLVSKAFSHSQA